MHDIKWIREQPDAFDAALARRGLEPGSQAVLALDGRHRSTTKDMQDLQARRNELSKAIGAAKQKGADANELMAEVGRMKDRLQALEEEERTIGQEMEELLSGLPNRPADDVPDGPDESANVVLREFGARPDFNFPPRQHFELGEGMGLMDFETAARLSGARFVVLSGALARLERALAAFMLDIHTKEFGYVEVAPPILVRDAAMYGTGQLPKFADDLFRTIAMDREKRQQIIDEELKTLFSPEDSLVRKVWETIQRLEDEGRLFDSYWLIPTAEVPLTNLVREQIVDTTDLPLRVTALTPCFRAEAGAAGKDTRGMLRQHQFNKVELVSVTAPEDSEAEHERMTSCAEEVLKRLGLHYRVVVLSTGDMGFAARKTYDIEVWLPGQGTYREISSCSNCGDFQARRMKARLRRPGQKGTEFVHTLNGSGLAVGRTLIALLENYQREDGSVTIPEALRKYMDGADAIGGGA